MDKFNENFDFMDYNNISGLGESDYENEDLFNVETTNNEVKEDKIEETSNIEIPIEYQETYENNGFDFSNDMVNVYQGETSVNETEFTDKLEKEEPKLNIEQDNLNEVTDEGNYNKENNNVNTEFLDSNNNFESSYIENNYELPVLQPTKAVNKNLLSETPIEELNKLTEYKEEKIETTDIKALFDRVGGSVKEASDIFKKNSEMKEKIDARFEELKKLQAEVEKAKKNQYDEINSYKVEVLDKLTEKKEEIEKRLNKLRDFQSSLEKERQEFEQYRKREKEEIEKVQKEIQDAYDSRREELSHVEDVLRKQKDALDEERNQLSLDIIQYEADKNELANNLLKFNEIVDSFTNGMDKIDKE